ncbi:hypothetical protein MCUN1_002989 [Malassezia cuniculi]|uniref:Uncharacterized protein n=1 Tax=Malassezia cuniculi TaxID=948313 RepID=A0AAF0J7C7_9BASI|nr:hypothetical protein MCUN1_002989 [Malassezia cuniculi]
MLHKQEKDKHGHWEHLSLQPLVCRVSVLESGGDTQMWLTVEWATDPDHTAKTVTLERIDLSAYAWQSRGGSSIVPQLDLKAVYSETRVAFRVRSSDGFHRFQIQLASQAEATALISAIKVCGN